MDIAGFCSNKAIVQVFCRHLERKIDIEIAQRIMYAQHKAEQEEGEQRASEKVNIFQAAHQVFGQKPTQIVPDQLAVSVANKGTVTRLNQELPRNEDDTKYIVDVVRVNKKQLSQEEAQDMRIFYWAAYYGFKKYVRLMIIHRRWSPFIKSFKN